MTYYIPPQSCSNLKCTNSFIPHREGKIQAHKDGWFLQKNDDAWCPEHLPEWIVEWRANRKKNNDVG